MFDIAHIIDIQWNGNAFESLVLPPSHKELILSFVKGQIDHKDDFDDIIEGKGQGIVILLAGVPGVGKTLTAESGTTNNSFESSNTDQRPSRGTPPCPTLLHDSG